ncbi:MAG: T9SS type A sorting domain-containing protein, partial [Saprospiraceae bacterium]|nr:T9SS type A sorting domain-containing protein [Saprospiraceae bacterium]
DWQDQDIVFRFRYGTNTSAEDNLGWVVDDIEFMDLLAYNSETCLTSDQGDNVCAIAPEEGTIVESKVVIGSAVETLDDLSLSVYPNPAQDILNVAINAETMQDMTISLVTIEGKLVAERKLQMQGKQQMLLNVSQLPAGFYFVKVATDKGNIVTKVVIE